MHYEGKEFYSTANITIYRTMKSRLFFVDERVLVTDHGMLDESMYRKRALTQLLNLNCLKSRLNLKRPLGSEKEKNLKKNLKGTTSFFSSEQKSRGIYARRCMS